MKKNSRLNKTLTLQDAMQAFLDTFNLQHKYSEANLIASWERIMGKTIASRTEKIYVKDGTLFLKISSSPLRNELRMAENRLIQMINEHLQKTIVDKVVFV